LVVLPLMAFAGFRMALQKTQGGVVERLGTLTQAEAVAGRVGIVSRVAFDQLPANPLGGGLGKSGYSIPAFLYGRTGYRDFVEVDGDLGRLVIEMGAVGLLVFGRLLYQGLRTSFVAVKELRSTPLGTVAVACAASFALAVIGFPTGSPFLSIPMGAMTWFFLGTLQKLLSQHQRGEFAAPATAAPTPRPAKAFLYAPPQRKTRSPRPP
jgi:hypothetical protein